MTAMVSGHWGCAGATPLPGEGGLAAGGLVWDKSLVMGVTELPPLWSCCGRLLALPLLSPCLALRVFRRVTSKWPDGTGCTRHILLCSSIQLDEGLQGDWGSPGDGGLPLPGWGSPGVLLPCGSRCLGTMVFPRGDGPSGSPATPMFPGSDGVLLPEQRTSVVRRHQGRRDGTMTLAGCLPLSLHRGEVGQAVRQMSHPRGGLSCCHRPSLPCPSCPEAEHPRGNKPRGFPDVGVQPGSWDLFGLGCLLLAKLQHPWGHPQGHPLVPSLSPPHELLGVQVFFRQSLNPSEDRDPPPWGP